MEKHRRTRFDRRGLVLGQGPTATSLPLWAGAMHYWRVDPTHWRACLRSLKAMGLSCVQTYVPWSVHEVAAGRTEWDRELDLGRFLDLAGEVGLSAIVRPGPHINAELTDFGFPSRVLRMPTVQARTAAGSPAFLPVPPRAFPVPSYASTVFREQVAGWLAACGEVIAPRCWPDGPVVAAQVDNEFHMLFRAGAFDLDYHPDALTWWQQSELAAEDAEPPRRWDPADADRCARWVAFKDHYAARALRWIGDELDAAGLDGLARFHNLPPGEPFHADLPAIERAVGGPCGVDFYHRAADYAAVRRRALHLAGSTSSLALAPEIGVGGPPWLPPMRWPDQQSAILGLLAAGVRGGCFYMAVDRDRWYGAAVGPRGAAVQPQHGFLRRLLATLDDVDWGNLARRAPVALVLSRADARYGTASSVANPLPSILGEFLRLGPAGAAELSRDPSAADYRRWVDAVERALALAQLPYDVLDEDVDMGHMARYQALVVPTLDRIGSGCWERLRGAAAAGTRLVLGPGTPTRDAWGEALDSGLPRGTGLIRAESLTDIDSLADDLTAIAGELDDTWIALDGAAVDVSVYFAGEQPRVMFAGNRSRATVEAGVSIAAGSRLRDPFTGDALAVADDVATVPLAPWQTRMFVIE